MFAWILRAFLIIVGFIASWFVTRDAPQFGIFEMAVALILFVLVVAVLLARALDTLPEPRSRAMVTRRQNNGASLDI